MQPESDADLRSELKTAIAAVREQITIQSTADHYVGSEGITEEALSNLRSELVRLEDALAGLR